MANRRRREREQIDPAVWKRPDMRAALAARDISAVFRLLQRMGVSQRHIAALTGQAQSEISEILAGRQVVSYDVLARIPGAASGSPTTTRRRPCWACPSRPARPRPRIRRPRTPVSC